VTEWTYAQADPAEELCQLHLFSVKNKAGTEFRITVREYAAPPAGHHLRFFAQADRQVNQAAAPLTPCGWGNTLMKALADCLRLIREFPCEPNAPSS
jgi:hypothetical protein